jgi:hypothetical protein
VNAHLANIPKHGHVAMWSCGHLTFGQVAKKVLSKLLLLLKMAKMAKKMALEGSNG